MNVKRIVSLLLLLSVSLLAQSTAPVPQPKSKTKKKAAATTSPVSELASEVRELRRMMEAQQQQIQQLQQQVQSRDQQIADLQNASSQGRSSAENAVASSSQNAQDVSALQSTVNDIKLNATNIAASMQEEQKRVGEMVESPLALHYKGVTITPGGFLAAESVWRQHAMASDVNTPFNSIPFPGNDAAHLTEFFGSGRQSRITLLAEGKIRNATLSGYYETDWLSAGVTSNNNQSNSYTNRVRQLFGQVALNSGWAFTGGQMWSLVTETKKGLDNRTEALPMTIDAQYHVGFSWMRQYGFRVTKNFNNKFWLGLAVENPETTNLGGGGFNNNFLIGAPGAGGGLYNGGATESGTAGFAPAANYSFNYTPDFIVKAAFEPGFGHYEVFGIISNFRDRIYPTAVAAAATAVSQCGVAPPIPAGTPPCTDVRTGGGAGANARWSFFQKQVDFGIHFLGGPGVGRYGTSQLAEVTARPDGTLALIHSYQTLGTLEWHSRHWDVYTNAGGEYAARSAYPNPATGGALSGYGRVDQTGTGNCLVEPNPAATSNGTKPGFTPASNTCNDTRDVIEGTFGFWYKAYNGPKGRIQFGPQYSYVVLNTWRDSVVPTPHTVENMFFTSFRYYLP